MRALFGARLSDLGPGDFVKAECTVCGHGMLIPAVGLLQGYDCGPTLRYSIWNRGSCRECDARGNAVVSIKSGERAA
jgi:hypothetical protein